jgi:hypothetical protein
MSSNVRHHYEHSTLDAGAGKDFVPTAIVHRVIRTLSTTLTATAAAAAVMQTVVDMVGIGTTIIAIT